MSDSWTDFIQFTQLDEKSTDGYIWIEERLTKRQATSRPDYLFRTLDEIDKKYLAEEEAEITIEKSKLDNTRRLRGIYYIDSEDKENKETIRNTRKNL